MTDIATGQPPDLDKFSTAFSVVGEKQEKAADVSGQSNCRTDAQGRGDSHLTEFSLRVAAVQFSQTDTVNSCFRRPVSPLENSEPALDWPHPGEG
jgi:hypothetical protein